MKLLSLLACVVCTFVVISLVVGAPTTPVKCAKHREVCDPELQPMNDYDHHGGQGQAACCFQVEWCSGFAENGTIVHRCVPILI
ncbi:hypothetical protein ACOMHN_020727 [Nucella lapillus]